MAASLPTIQSLPIRTPFYGTTDIQRNFTSQTTKDDDGIFHNTLRGRQLFGREVMMPDGYTLTVVEFTTSPVTAGSEPQRLSAGAAGSSPSSAIVSGRSAAATQPRTVRTSHESTSYLLWEHDQVPPTTNAAQQWISLAAALHA